MADNHNRIDQEIDLPDDLVIQIQDTIHDLARHTTGVSTRAIASSLHVSDRQTLRYLTQLEDDGLVFRIGIRGGWRNAA